MCKRPLQFVGTMDAAILKDGILLENSDNKNLFDTIGTSDEKAPLILRDYLSYEEMQISALIGVSSPTYFINNGSRSNKGIAQDPETYEKRGVYVGLVGPRFERPGLMEWQHLIVSPQQNTSENGYGLHNTNPESKKLALWKKLYDTELPTHDEVISQKNIDGRHTPTFNLNIFEATHKNLFFDTLLYKERIKLVVEPFLHDANNRAFKAQKQAYVHMVGLGLGAWKIHDTQDKLYINACDEIFHKTRFDYIAAIDFSHFDCKNHPTLYHDKQYTYGGNKIKIHFSKRNPADKLVGANANKLLVAAYAWDGNAFPGNEYWGGSLSASGDPAAACCSTITELQNPYINLHLNSASPKLYP